MWKNRSSEAASQYQLEFFQLDARVDVMAKIGDMTRHVALTLSVLESTATSYVRILNADGLITRGGRGRSAPDMTSRDIARAVIALMAAESLDEVAAITHLVRQAEYVFAVPNEWSSGDEPSSYDWLRLTFEDALTDQIEFFSGGAALTGDAVIPFDGDNTSVEISSTSLIAAIQVGTETFEFASNENEPVSYADDWPDLPARERLVARSLIGGINVRKSITHLELRELGKLVTLRSGLAQP